MRLKFIPFCLLSATFLSSHAVSLHSSASAQEKSGPAIAGTVIGRHTILIARPYDANRAVTAVRFLLDGNTLAEIGAPGRFDWNATNIRSGRHVIQVQAFAGESFVGQSEPMAVYLSDTAAASALEVPFFTYEDSRRASGIPAPKLAKTYAAGPRLDQANEPASRVGRVTVDVFLNGERQEFAPAARLASADELSPAAGKPAPLPRSRRERRKALARLKAAPKPAKTVWIPARPLLQKLGARLRWQASSRTLVADLRMAGGVRRLSLKAGQDGARADIDGRRLEVKSPVREADNAIMVPLAFCEQALDLRVSWRPEARRVEMFTTIYPA